MSPSGSAARRVKPLRIELGLALIIKLALLLILWALFFGPSNQVKVSAPVMSRVLLDHPASEPPGQPGGRH